METAYLGTSNQNNWNIMVSQQNEFTTELGNTKAFIYLRLSEYCWITPSTSSRGLFNNIHWILSFRPHIFFFCSIYSIVANKTGARRQASVVISCRIQTSNHECIFFFYSIYSIVANKTGVRRQASGVISCRIQTSNHECKEDHAPGREGGRGVKKWHWGIFLVFFPRIIWTPPR